jgi:hypothetical protein
MLRKMLSLGAVIVVAVAFGAGSAAAAKCGDAGKPDKWAHSNNGSKGTDGFSDGRLAN